MKLGFTFFTAFLLNGCVILWFTAKEAPRWKMYDEVMRLESEQEYALGEQKYMELIDECNREGIHVVREYDGLPFTYTMQGKYREAYNMSQKILELRREKGENAADISSNYLEMGDILSAQGKYDEAKGYYDQALTHADIWGQTNRYNAQFKVMSIYPHLGMYYIQLGHYEQAQKLYQEYYDLCKKEGLARGDELGRAGVGLGSCYYYLHDNGMAEKLLTNAVDLNTNSFVPFMGDLTQSLLMLGKIKERLNKPQEAMDAYRKAQRYAHQGIVSPCRVEEADAFHQIGRFQLKQSKSDEARVAYNESIRLRLQTQGPLQPAYADSLRGLADVTASQGDLTSATLNATKALEILDKALVPTHPRIAPTLVALASIDILTSHSEQAAPLNARLEIILQKALGPWKDDSMDTVQFYAELLKKAGKIAEVKWLEELYARQKDKR